MHVIDRAIQAVGGPTKASHICDCSVFSVYNWRKLGRIPDGRHAVLLARAATRAGVPMRIGELVGLDIAPDEDGFVAIAPSKDPMSATHQPPGILLRNCPEALTNYAA